MPNIYLGDVTSTAGTQSDPADDILTDIANAITGAGAAIEAAAGAAASAFWADLIQPIVNGLSYAFGTLWQVSASGISWVIQQLQQWSAGIFADIESGVSQIWTAISTFIQNGINELLGTVGNVWTWIQQANTNFVIWVQSGIENAIPAIAAALSAAWGDVGGTLSNVWNSIQNLGGTLYSDLSNYIGNVQSALSQFIAGIGNSIHTDISFMTSTLNDVWQKVAALPDYITNSLATIGTTVSDAVNNAVSGTGSALSGLGQWIWQGIIDLIVNPAKVWFADIANTVTKGISDVITGIQNAVMNVASGDPTGATARAMNAILEIGGVVTAVWVGATLLDALYPTKQTLLSELTGLLERIGGLTTLTAVVAGAVTTVAFATPIEHELNFTFRPQLAPQGDLDHGYLRGLVNQGDYNNQMGYYGYNSQWVQLHQSLLIRVMNEGDLNKALFYGLIQESDWETGLAQLGIGANEIQIKMQTRYRLPNARIIANLFVQGGITLDNLGPYLQRAGYSPDDQALLIAAYQLSQTQKATSEFYTILRTGYKLGWLTEAICRQQMSAISEPEFAIDYRIQSFKLDYAVQTNEDKKKVLVEGYEKKALTVDDLRTGLTNLGMETTKMEDLIAYEQFKETPKPTATATKATAT
jgi:hypothetical protein